ncbi:MAG: DUF1116 domain-containing protein [Chloroflexi bacterium]|nr:DUF1116 domain-containing protein [Chloroflexota bacterium]
MVKLRTAEPVLIDIVPAGDVIPVLKERVLLHAGPPVDWRDMCGPMQGAVIGAMRYEGWAGTEAEAEEMAAGGGVTLLPAHDSGAVGPMTGIFSYSMPVFVVENRASGNRAYCTINEGLGRVMRFGANDASVIDRLRWIRGTLAPALQEAVLRAGSIELKPIMAQALAMGDEMHQRNVAATSLFFRRVAPHLVRNTPSGPGLGEVVDFLTGNDQFFLNLAMAAGKATMDAVASIEGTTIVTAMSRNGTDFGIRLGALGERWFTAPCLMPQGLYFPGFSSSDANPDMGDSSILETMGLGGFAMAASPAVAGFVGAGSYQDALNYTREMGEITLGQNPGLAIPGLDFQGTPCGIDVRKVVETGIAPAINTGIAHREAGVGQVGAGIVRAPLECFYQALEALVDQMESG